MPSTQHKHRLYLRSPSCTLVCLAKTAALEVLSFNLFLEGEKVLCLRAKGVLKKILEEKRVRHLEVVFGKEFGFEEDCEILNKKPLRSLLAFDLEAHTKLRLKDYTWHYVSLGKYQDRIRLGVIGIEKFWIAALAEICQDIDVYLYSIKKQTAKKKLGKDCIGAILKEDQPLCIHPDNTQTIEFLSFRQRIYFWLQAYRREIFILLGVFCMLMGWFNYKLVKTLDRLRSITADAQIVNETLYAFEKDRRYYTSRIQDLESIIDYQLQIAHCQAYWPRIFNTLQDSLYGVGHAWLEGLDVRPISSSSTLEMDIQGIFLTKAESQQSLNYERNHFADLKLEKLITLLSKEQGMIVFRKCSLYPKSNDEIGFELRLILSFP